MGYLLIEDIKEDNKISTNNNKKNGYRTMFNVGFPSCIIDFIMWEFCHVNPSEMQSRKCNINLRWMESLGSKMMILTFEFYTVEIFCISHKCNGCREMFLMIPCM